MKKNLSLAILSLLLISVLMMGCMPSASETPMSPTAEHSPESGPTATPEEEGRFTIQSNEEFIEPISTLYKAFYGEELLVFVETGGDLLVTNPEKMDGDHPGVPATFMPGAVLVQDNENEDVSAFINFAVSIEGQKELIAAGELPTAITLTDQDGNAVTIPQPVERVISAYGPTTAIVYSVGEKDRLVSASYLGAKDPLGSTVMAEIDSRFPEIMGDDKFSQQEFNVEEAATVEPDLILTSARSAWLDVAGELEVPIFLYEAETFERLKEAVLLTGELFGPQASAAALTWDTYFEALVNQIKEKTADIPSNELPKILFTGTAPLRVASGDMFQTEIIEAAGGISVSKELTGYWNDVNLEQVAIWDPDIIIVPPYGGANVEAITESPEWQILDAVQAGRVYQMPKLVAPWDTPAPDSVLGIVWMAQLLHPELIDLDCSDEALYFYNTFYQYAIPTELSDEICSYD
jgi:iron complex transport system substrate-binding protein